MFTAKFRKRTSYIQGRPQERGTVRTMASSSDTLSNACIGYKYFYKNLKKKTKICLL